ncbi:MAG: glycosyltransferase [Bacteroidota bacterium]|nr:glycosyltransferase [Bacteroidota bacterium]
MPKISVIVCTYNRGDYVPGVLNSISGQNFPLSDYEIVFVNNNSNDSTAENCQQFGDKNPEVNFKYFVEKKQGLSHARNRGIKESEGEILAFIDDDALAHADYLLYMRKFFENSSYSAGGGKIYPKYESRRPRWMSRFLEPVMSVIDLGNEVKNFPKNKFPIGANMMFRKKVFDRVGYFDTELGRTGKNMLGGEEKDLFFKMRAQNMTVGYVPDVVVSHIIPDERLSRQFIKKQAKGIGKSERIRAENYEAVKLGVTYFKELLKWGATLVLAFYYALWLQFSKSEMLIKFRFWVSRGLFRNG